MLALCLVVVGLVPSIALAQEQAPVRLYVLERVIFGPTKAPLPDGYRPPSESVADLDGGVIEFTIDYAADRVEIGDGLRRRAIAIGQGCFGRAEDDSLEHVEANG
ncbi:MAG: hypothetical protein AAGI46_15635, partial [Planctomycetota bacterium]